MSEAVAEVFRPANRRRGTGLGAAIALLALGFALSGCGNCGGWTYPWYKASQPNSCGSERPSQQSIALPLAE
jgi:hypothetical protein